MTAPLPPPPAPAIRRWTTVDAEGDAGIAFWVDAICEAFLQMTADSRAGRGFQGTLEQQACGPLELNFIHADQQEVWRDRRHIARSTDNFFYLLHNRHGRLLVRQRDREVVVPAGSCVLVDSKQPYYFSFPDGESCLSVQLPQAWLRTWVPAPEEAVAMRWGNAEGWGGVLAQALTNLGADGMDALPVSRTVLADQLGALVAMAAGAPQPSRPGRRAVLVDRLRQTLAASFHDPGLSPADVASRHGISTRYLHLLFAETGTTFTRELVAIRLERARRLVGDRNFADLSIGEIAWRCGFNDPSHFARLFRKRFGSAPGAMRG